MYISICQLLIHIPICEFDMTLTFNEVNMLTARAYLFFLHILSRQLDF